MCDAEVDAGRFGEALDGAAIHAAHESPVEAERSQGFPGIAVCEECGVADLPCGLFDLASLLDEQPGEGPA